MDTSSVLCYLCVSTGAYNIQAPKPQFLHLENGINDLFFVPQVLKKKKKGFVTDRVSLPLSTALAPRRYSMIDVSSIEVECAMSTG